ncbi:hypothetical protein Skr01_57450 [Sphaerisporangium krabiense]|uniref:Uncharacterized protein n=1 Tax=Sphaerisporangium krabiense TaxID=763782 RepID=A0A7W8Z8V0_9ACTN|nr:hypothetical protein [Sphaerisporangium krabiense]MBB5629490.1 hypothetical protein [Sphaerisporangium krabiense]GII65660.1 hypothetical protein Skr01_57450 [Sphaerisporangium krabiense]
MEPYRRDKADDEVTRGRAQVDLADHDRAGGPFADERVDLADHDRAGGSLADEGLGGLRDARAENGRAPSGTADPAHTATSPGSDLAEPAEARDAERRRERDDALRDPDSVPTQPGRAGGAGAHGEARPTPDPVLDFEPTGRLGQPPEAADLIVYPKPAERAGTDELTTTSGPVTGPGLTDTGHDKHDKGDDLVRENEVTTKDRAGLTVAKDAAHESSHAADLDRDGVTARDGATDGAIAHDGAPDGVTTHGAPGGAITHGAPDSVTTHGAPGGAIAHGASDGVTADGATDGVGLGPGAGVRAGGNGLGDGRGSADGDFLGRWREVQAGFVDDPRDAVERADRLVEEAVDALTTRRKNLADRWKNGGDGDTERLRLALRDYRSLLEELVGLTHGNAGQAGSPARHESR